jgi:hypothetical protein
MRTLALAAAVVSASLAFGAPAAWGGDPEPRAGAAAPGADQRMADLHARLKDLEERIVGCRAAAKDFAAAGRKEMALSHQRVGQALEVEAAFIRERIAGRSGHEPRFEAARTAVIRSLGDVKGARVELHRAAVAELKAQSEREEAAAKDAKAAGREDEARAHAEASKHLWKKAEEMERAIGEASKRVDEHKMRVQDHAAAVEALKARVSELRAQSGELEAKAKEFQANGSEKAASEHLEKAKAAHREAEALREKLEAKRRALDEDAAARRAKEAKGAGHGEGRKAADDLRVVIEQMRREIQELRDAVEALRSQPK